MEGGIPSQLNVTADADPVDWVELHGDMLFGYAMRRLGDRATAEDLVQETLLTGLQHRDTFAGRSSRGTWLVAILKHKITDHLRRVSRERAATDDDPLTDFVEERFDKRGVWQSSPKSWRVPAEATPEREEMLTTLRRCLERLPGPSAELLQLTERGEATAASLGAMLGLSESNVWVRVYRARTALRECIERNWFGRKKGGGS